MFAIKKFYFHASVQLVTWNVATKFPGADTNLSSLLNDSKPDIILLGLQVSQIIFKSQIIVIFTTGS